MRSGNRSETKRNQTNSMLIESASAITNKKKTNASSGASATSNTSKITVTNLKKSKPSSTTSADSLQTNQLNSKSTTTITQAQSDTSSTSKMSSSSSTSSASTTSAQCSSLFQPLLSFSSSTSSQALLNNPMLMKKQVFIDKYSSHLEKIFEEGKSNVFEQKTFTFNSDQKKYCAFYNLFYSETEFKIKPNTKESIDHRCYICGEIKKCPIGKPGNLKGHLNTHRGAIKKLDGWLTKYSVHMKAEDSEDESISYDMLSLSLYFQSSTMASRELINESLRNLVKVKMPTEKTFRDKILPDVLKLVKKKLSNILNKSEFIAVSTDIWTDKSMKDFIAVSASAFIDGKKENYIINIMRMPGRHCAEVIKEALEEMINEFNFDKRKLIAFVTDEGSSLVRLVKQTEDLKALFDEWLNEEFDQIYDEEEVEEEEEQQQQTNKIKIVDGFKELDSDILNQLKETLPIIQVIDFLAESAEKILKLVDDTEDQVLKSDFTKDIDHYLLEKNAEIIRILTIKVGSKIRPRFSCSAHKTNIAVKNAIQRHKRISNILSTLSRFASENRNTIALAKIFEANKARLLYENLTRWNSSYLMMVSFLRAYSKEVFTDEFKCPIERKTIELYIQILKPIHDMSIHFQRSNSDISDVFPTILLLINQI